MNRYRIYRDDNYIIIYSEDGKHIWTGLAKDVQIIPNTEILGQYKIINVNGWGCAVTVNIGQLLKENGIPYTLQEWESWYFDNTGVIMNPSDYDLEEFNNNSSDPFVRDSDLTPYLQIGWTLDFMQGNITTTLYAPYDFKINSVTDVHNTPSTAITLNGSPYVIGSSVLFGDELVVSVDIISVITLDIEKI